VYETWSPDAKTEFEFLGNIIWKGKLDQQISEEGLLVIGARKALRDSRQK
jgi:hypothetical protein